MGLRAPWMMRAKTATFRPLSRHIEARCLELEVDIPLPEVGAPVEIRSVARKGQLARGADHVSVGRVRGATPPDKKIADVGDSCRAKLDLGRLDQHLAPATAGPAVVRDPARHGRGLACDARGSHRCLGVGHRQLDPRDRKQRNRDREREQRGTQHNRDREQWEGGPQGDHAEPRPRGDQHHRAGDRPRPRQREHQAGIAGHSVK